MHSTIIEWSYRKDAEPMGEDAVFETLQYTECCPDYVRAYGEEFMEDNISTILGLVEDGRGSCYDVKGKFAQITPEMKARYFGPKYDEFRKVLDMVYEKMTPESFVTGKYDSFLLKLQRKYDYPGAVWFVNTDEEEYSMTMDAFVRFASPDIKYYIVSAYDYHC